MPVVICPGESETGISNTTSGRGASLGSAYVSNTAPKKTKPTPTRPVRGVRIFIQTHQQQNKFPQSYHPQRPGEAGPPTMINIAEFLVNYHTRERHGTAHEPTPDLRAYCTS